MRNALVDERRGAGLARRRRRWRRLLSLRAERARRRLWTAAIGMDYSMGGDLVGLAVKGFLAVLLWLDRQLKRSERDIRGGIKLVIAELFAVAMGLNCDAPI